MGGNGWVCGKKRREWALGLGGGKGRRVWALELDAVTRERARAGEAGKGYVARGVTAFSR